MSLIRGTFKKTRKQLKFVFFFFFWCSVDTSTFVEVVIRVLHGAD